MFRSIFDDPFFGDPFADLHGRQMMVPSIMNSAQYQQPYAANGRRHAEPGMMMMSSPFDMLGMGGMFGDMNRMMQTMQSNMMPMMTMPMHGGGGGLQAGLPGSSFQSSFTSISYGEDGQPHVYQSSSSTKLGPDGVKETKKTEKDSRRGLQKMAIGHHIGDQAHIIEKSNNTKTGETEENQEFVNLDEDEAEQFNREFKRRVQSAPHQAHRAAIAHPHHHQARHQPYRPPQAIGYHHLPSDNHSRPSTNNHPRHHRHHRDDCA